MAETYELFVEDKTLLFDRFRRCLRGPARADWDIIVNGTTLDKATLTTALKELLIEIVGEDAEHNLTNYMERTSKPKNSQVSSLDSKNPTHEYLSRVNCWISKKIF